MADGTIANVENPNTSSEIHQELIHFPGDWRFLGVAMGLLVVILGTVGNGLTVWAYKNNRNLQTSFNVLIANLCCIELIFALVIIPLQIPGMIIAENPYPKEFCTIAGYLYYCSFAASLHNLVAIAINRYIGIVNTKSYQKLFTGNSLRLWVISIWITSPLLYLPLPIAGNIGWKNSSLRCSVITTNVGVSYYNMGLNVIFQAGGLVILIALYSAIIKKVKEVQKKLKVHKKASFRRSATWSKGTRQTLTDGKFEIHTPGTTSGEEAIDDYRPSSIISGGFQFRPAKDAEWQSDSAFASDREQISAKGQHFLTENTNSLASNLTPLRSPLRSPSPNHMPQNRQKRRTSLWQMLFRSKTDAEEHREETKQASYTIPTTDDESNKDHKDAEDQLEQVKVILRNMEEEKKEIRRKKSLSAPTMPSLEDLMDTSRKNSSAVATNIPEKVIETPEPGSSESSPQLKRALTLGVKYQKHITRGGRTGSVRMTQEYSRFLHPNHTIRSISIEDKAVCASLPNVKSSSTDTTSHKRAGTIARKIKGNREKRETRQKRKQRLKMIKKRHARERQLVYSSLWICIAYAVLILPASLLFVAQVIFNFKAPAAAVLILGSISWFHAVVNPFIYGYMNHLYRKEYGQIAKFIEKKITTCAR